MSSVPVIMVADDARPAPAALPTSLRQRIKAWITKIWAHKWLVALAVTIMAAAAYFIVPMVRGTAVPFDVVTRADLVETVVASGHVESPYRVAIASQMTGTVVSVAVEEGDTVRQGQVLILLSADELGNTLAQAQATVAQAAARVRQITELSLPQALAARRSAAASLLSTQQIYNRAAALMDKGFVTRAYFDEVTRNRDMARTEVAAADAQIRSARDGGSDLAAAEADLAQANAGAQAAQARLSYATITAPRDGILISRTVERGSVVTPGAELMQLSPGGTMQIILQIDERNLSRIAIGQTARVSADAYPKQHFVATVTYINPGIDIARASTMVKLTMQNAPPYLQQNMTVSVDIETARRADILSLPSGSVRDALTDAPWVMVIEQGRAARRNVVLGLQGDTRIEITGGVAKGIVVIPATSEIVEGDRVRPTLP